MNVNVINNGKRLNNKIQTASFLNVNLKSFVFCILTCTHDVHHLFKNFR